MWAWNEIPFNITRSFCNYDLNLILLHCLGVPSCSLSRSFFSCLDSFCCRFLHFSQWKLGFFINKERKNLFKILWMFLLTRVKVWFFLCKYWNDLWMFRLVFRLFQLNLWELFDCVWSFNLFDGQEEAWWVFYLATRQL